jgi:hypothetical protein
VTLRSADGRTQWTVEPEARRDRYILCQTAEHHPTEVRQPDDQDSHTQVHAAPSCSPPTLLLIALTSHLYYSYFHLYRPTVESRLALYSSAQKQAEEVRVQIRKHHQASVKKGAFKKFSIEIEGVRVVAFRPRFSCGKDTNILITGSIQFQKLMEKHIAEVDSVLAAMKKTSGAK